MQCNVNSLVFLIAVSNPNQTLSIDMMNKATSFQMINAAGFLGIGAK